MIFQVIKLKVPMKAVFRWAFVNTSRLWKKDKVFSWNLHYDRYKEPSLGTNCAPLVADLFLFCYERDFMMSLSDDK